MLSLRRSSRLRQGLLKKSGNSKLQSKPIPPISLTFAVRNEKTARLTVPMNNVSGTESAGLSDIIHQMEKKLDSA